MRLQLEEEDLEDRAAEDDYEQMLDKEAQKLRIRGFEPKVSTGANVTLTNCAKHRMPAALLGSHQ